MVRIFNGGLGLGCGFGGWLGSVVMTAIAVHPVLATPIAQPFQLADTHEPMAQLQPKPRSRQSAGHLLSPQQIRQLTQLPIPVVVPTDLPAGFRVVKAEGEQGQYANGDDDSGYMLEYVGKGNVCFVIYTSKDAPRRLKQIGQVQSGVGLAKIYEERYDNQTSWVSFLPIQGNPVLISPFSRLNPVSNEYERCKPLSRADYDRILKSLQRLK